MPLFARSDVLEVAVSNAHGGCGTKHERPAVPNGETLVSVWQLGCPMCEHHLQGDPQWSGTRSGIPESPDEEERRLDQEKRGQREVAEATGTALEKIAEMPAVLSQFVTFMMNGGVNGPSAGMPGAFIQCPSGHQTPAGGSFCMQCGAPVARLLGQVGPVAVKTADGGHIITALHAPTPIDAQLGTLDDKSLAELRNMALARNLPTKRSKADQIRVLHESLLAAQ
jgi:hypothetical protein